MTLFNVIVYETNVITLQVEAEDDIEAARLVESDINQYPVISEEVVDWNVDFVEEGWWHKMLIDTLGQVIMASILHALNVNNQTRYFTSVGVH